MSTSYPVIEIEQDAYGSVVIPLSDELCHDMSLQPSERFTVGRRRYSYSRSSSRWLHH